MSETSTANAEQKSAALNSARQRSRRNSLDKEEEENNKKETQKTPTKQKTPERKMETPNITSPQIPPILNSAKTRGKKNEDQNPENQEKINEAAIAKKQQQARRRLLLAAKGGQAGIVKEAGKMALESLNNKDTALAYKRELNANRLWTALIYDVSGTSLIILNLWMLGLIPNSIEKMYLGKFRGPLVFPSKISGTVLILFTDFIVFILLFLVILLIGTVAWSYSNPIEATIKFGQELIDFIL